MEIKKAVFNNVNTREVWDEVCENYSPDFDETNRTDLDNIALTFSLLSVMHGQIQNGGIIQFIDNGSGNYFHETIEAAEKISDSILVEILTKAASVFPNATVPKDWDERRNVVDAIGDAHTADFVVDEEWEFFWQELDERYYSNQQLFYKKVVDYLRDHATLID